MAKLSDADRIALMNAIAARDGTASQISQWYGIPVPALRTFVEENKAELKELRQEIEAEERTDDTSLADVSVSDLDNLWISKKVERLGRFQRIADLLFVEAQKDPTDSTVLRELRSYMAAAANELGQLLNRGAGDTSTNSMTIDINGVEMDKLQ